jgi:Xaa-Pro dipeptidase
MRTVEIAVAGAAGLGKARTRNIAVTTLTASGTPRVTEPRTIAFDRGEYTARLAAIRREMAGRDLDALLLVDPRNVFYLSGVESQGGGHLQCLIVRPDQPLALVTWNFEEDNAALTSGLADIVAYGWFDDPVAALAAALHERGLERGRLGIERGARELSALTHGQLAAALPEATLVDGWGIVERARRTKSPAELQYMREAASITDAAVAAGYAAIHEGATDTEIAAAASNAAYAAGSETVCWGPIVASGYRGGVMHTSFHGRTVRRGETVYLELSGEVHRYVAPVMRTAVIGAPSPEMAAFRDAGLAALDALMGTAKAGVPASEAARAAARELQPLGDALYFHDLYGYMVGLGFPPSWYETLGYDLKEANDEPLEAGMTFHLPISLRKRGAFGVCQSHTVVITERGCEPLTRSEPRLREIRA